MKCDTCREMLTGYLKAELEDARKAEVEEHLATCAECAKECEGARKVLTTLDQASDEPIIKLVDKIIKQAIDEGASDIHIQPRSDHEMVRLRVDGVLRDIVKMPNDVHPYIVNRVKIMAGLSLTEHHLPQDAMMRVKVNDRDHDLRVSVVPSLRGETMVLRLLPPEAAKLTLEQVHLVGEQREQLNKLICAPYGTVFVTGPSGSGKTTTLYAILNELNRSDLHVMTIENPVAYQLDGMTQISVNPQAGLDFKTAMRSVMMQDPDIIMCGEIRDLETLELCLQASIWGHLVLSTLHTLDVVSVIRRLLDVGANRFMVAQSLVGATAQRLLRRICSECKEEYEPTGAEREWLQTVGVEAPAKLWQGRGCEECKQTGCRGRTAAYEILVVDDEIKSLLNNNAPLGEIEKLAATKVKPMKQSAAEMAVAGEIAVAEAMRVMVSLPEY